MEPQEKQQKTIPFCIIREVDKNREKPSTKLALTPYFLLRGHASTPE